MSSLPNDPVPLYDFNPGTKTWKIHAHKITSITNGNLVLQAAGANSEIYFAQKNNEVYKISDLLASGSVDYVTVNSNPGSISIGQYAMSSNAGTTGNIAIGHYALRGDNITGSNNIAIGYCAHGQSPHGGLSLTGSNNIIIGASSQASSTSIDNEITLGNSSNTLFRMPGLSGSNGDVLTYNNGYIEFASGGGGGGVSELNDLTDAYKDATNLVLGSDLVRNEVCNTIVGVSAGGQEAWGQRCTYIGHACGRYNSSSFSVAMGHETLRNGDGNHNTAIGYVASCLASGACNTTLGSHALYSGSGGNNVAIGYYALRGDNITGSNNIAIGYCAHGQSPHGGLSLTGSNNIIIGASSQASSTSIDNEITLGNSSNTLFRMPGLSGSNGDVLTYNNGYIEFASGGGGGGGGLTADANGTYTIGDTGVPGNLIIKNHNNLDTNFWDADTTNYLQVNCIRGPLHGTPSATVQSDWDTYGSMFFYPNHSAIYVMPDTNIYARMWSRDLTVGSGTTNRYSHIYSQDVVFKSDNTSSPAQNIKFMDGAWNEQARIVSHTGAATFTSVTQTSDDRYKSRTKDISNAGEYLMKLKPCTYEKHPGLRVEEGVEDSDLSGIYHYTESGLIAQDLEKIPGLEWTVKNIEKEIISNEEKEFFNKERHEDKNIKPSDFPKTYMNTKSVDYTNFIAYLIKGFQEQQNTIQEQQNLINNLISRIEILETK